ncbi:MAG: hypothetical protein WC686_02935 [Candidatus Shapirobacteria bacterium]
MFTANEDFTGTIGARGTFSIFAIWAVITQIIFVPFFIFGILVGLIKGDWKRLKGYLKVYYYFTTGLFLLSLYSFGSLLIDKGLPIYFWMLTMLAVSLPIKSRLNRKEKKKLNLWDFLAFNAALVLFFILFGVFGMVNFYIWLLTEICLLAIYFGFLFKKPGVVSRDETS